MKHRPLGASGIDVSVMSLGSWRTYERIPREQGVSVVASMALHQGALTGKYGNGGGGRLAEELDDPDCEPALRAAADLRRVAVERGTTPAVLALAFAARRAARGQRALRGYDAGAGARERARDR